MAYKIERFSATGFKSPNEAYPHNEDALVETSRVYGVIDGARPPSDLWIDGITSATYLARFIQNILVSKNIKVEVSDNSAKSLLSSANDEWREHINDCYPEIVALGKEGPAAAAALVHLHSKSEYTWARTGDCYLFEVLHDGSLNGVGPAQDSAFDNEKQRLDLLQKYLRQGHTLQAVKNFPDYKVLMKELAEGRNITRSTLNGDEAFGRLLQGGIRPLSIVKSLILMSDGFSWPVEGLSFDPALGAKAIVELGVTGAYRELVTMHESDPNFLKYLRLKHMDDASALVVTL